MPPIPYIFSFPNKRTEHTAIRNNIGPARAWRAPNHPQAAVITMGALDDLAAKLGISPLDLWLKNLDITGPRKETYREELSIAAELMGSVYWRLLRKLERRRFNVFGPELTRLSKGHKALLILRSWWRFASGAMSPNYGV